LLLRQTIIRFATNVNTNDLLALFSEKFNSIPFPKHKLFLSFFLTFFFKKGLSGLALSSAVS
jgi:hypothetical protein